MFGPHSDICQKAERLRKADPVKNKDLRAEGEVKFSPAAVLEQTLFSTFKDACRRADLGFGHDLCVYRLCCALCM